MLPEFAGRTVLLVIVAAVPALLRWWFGRGIVRRASDPAVAERMLETARKTAPATVLAIAVLLVLSPRAAFWTLPLLLLLRLVAGYPIRRALFGETWSLTGYVSFFLRLIVAIYGLWIAIALLPALIANTGRWHWAAALALAAILVAWNGRTASVVRWILRVEPISRPELVGRFTAMANATTVPVPRFEVVKLRGGVLANAVALPSPRAASVVFTDTLFEELSEDEAAAICAHELAHLEYYSPTRVRRMQYVTTAAIIAGALVVPVSHALALSVVSLATAWYVAVFGLAAWRARHRQRHETASDLRAMALCGDAEALVRALTKLHTLGRVPRRLDPQFERQATHPSLARRIRDIRRASGTRPSALEENATFVAPERSTTVTFSASHVQWSEGDAAIHTLTYRHLVEARIAAPPSGPARLVVVERGGRRWTMALDAGDLARAQAVLDVVDGQIGDAPLPPVWPRVSRVVCAILAVLAVLVGHITAALLALAVSIRPSAMLLAAAGLGALTASALTLREVGARSGTLLLAFALGVGALSTLALARAARAEEDHQRRPPGILILAACTAAGLLMLLVAGLDAVSLHQSARLFSGATVLPLALAGALIISRRPSRQLAGVGVLLTGAAVATIGSPWFLDRFAADPLFVRAKPSVVHVLDARPAGEFSISFDSSAVRFSPSGRVAAFTEEREDEEDTMLTFHVGNVGSPLVAVNADDLAFVDDERALVLVKGRDDLEIREIGAAAPTEIRWRQTLPLLAGAHVWFDPADATWTVLGWSRSSDVVRLRAAIGSVAFDQTRWSLGSTDRGYVNAVAASGDRAVLVESHYEFGPLQSAGLRFLSVLPFTMPKTESRFWSLGPRGMAERHGSRFGAQCVPAGLGSDRLACSVYDGTFTRVFTLDASGQVVPVALFTGRFYCRQSAGADWVTGWLESSPLALNLSTGRSVRLPGHSGEWIAGITRDNRTAATISNDGSASRIRLYPLPAELQHPPLQGSDSLPVR
jgi:Zn-dependent protease with chaperone function